MAVNRPASASGSGPVNSTNSKPSRPSGLSWGMAHLFVRDPRGGSLAERPAGGKWVARGRVQPLSRPPAFAVPESYDGPPSFPPHAHPRLRARRSFGGDL